jgi:hypothetical protein
MPVVYLIGNPDGIPSPETMVDSVRSTVTAMVRTTPGGHDRDVIRVGYEIECRVGV